MNAVQLSAASHEATLINTVPSAVQHLLQAGTLPSSLRVINIAGEPLQLSLVQQLYKHTNVQCVYNLYGPSEDTTYSTSALIRQDADIVTIGRPITNKQCYVLDDRFEPVPIGFSGELYVGGAGLARGYANRAGLTAERFIPSPFGDGDRLYRTGDLARYLADGSLEFLGRADQQVKIRGYRIEPGEIEAVLLAHEHVAQAVVEAREDAGEKRLVAYVVWRGGCEPDAGGLRSHLKRSLPDYMVPAAFVALEALPLTPSGKVDRRALPAPDGEALRGRYAAPRTPVEEALASIWCEVLKAEVAGIDDDFFALGGHSLIAMRIIARVRDTFEVELPVRELFTAPTIRALAQRIDDARREQGGLVLPALEARARGGSLPLSYAQERLWFLDQLGLAGAAYNMPVGLRLEGALDAGALERSFGEVVRRHESLRTRFDLADGQGVQVIDDAGEFRLEVVDLSGLGGDEREGEVLRLAQEDAERPFDLARGPLFRAKLVRLGREDHVALVNMHHIVSDGWSVGTLIREMRALYGSYSRGLASPLPGLGLQYGDYAVWQRAWLKGDALADQVGYWRARLSGSPSVLSVSTDRPRPAVASYRGSGFEFSLSPALSRGLAALARREGATLFMVLLAAFDVLLSRWSGQTDIVVGTPVANRSHSGTEGLIGFFVNTLVLRTDVSGDPSFVVLLRRVKEAALGAYAHQDVPFEKLVEELQPERDLSRQPLFQVMFALENVPQEDLELPGLRLSHLRSSRVTAKFDLSVSLHESGSGLRGFVEYATDLFDGPTIERLAGHYETLLAGIVAAPESRLCDLPLLSDGERHRLVVEWNDTSASYPRDKCLHELFAEQVARAPDAVAVVFEDERLTYGELDRRANRLAHQLRGLGVGPETIVGLCVPRSVEMVVGLLGILKAGGAYLPLDPDYPHDRLCYMIEDSRCPVLVTRSPVVSGLPVQAAIVRLDADREAIDGQPATAPVSQAGPDNLAYVIYTSGSTGKPKGTLLHHAGLRNLARAQALGFNIRSDSRVLQFASLSFDASISEIAMTFCSGAALYLAKGPPVSGSDLGDILIEHQITTVTLPPSTLELLPENDFPHLETLIVAGEACPAEWLRRFASRRRIINAYGPTETTVCATFADYCGDERASIGRPIPDMQVYVLDDALNVAPIGVMGELYVGGAGVGRGYIGRPGLTAERFVPNPFGTGERLYRTGDLACWRVDGNLEFLGRRDNQVKVRGFRIELGEIETVLGQQPSLKQAAVLIDEREPTDKRVVAYVVPRNEGFDLTALRSTLKERLPQYMLPSIIIPLPSLPLTPTGKIDRLALSALGSAVQSGPVIAPRTPVEEQLAAAFVHVLKVEQLGIHDNFFNIGGHSLLAVQLVRRIKEQMRRDVPLARFLASPTVASVAELLSGLGSSIEHRIHRFASQGSTHAIVFLPTVFGLPTIYRPLTPYLPSNADVIGVQNFGLNATEKPLLTIEDIAAEIRQLLHKAGKYRTYTLIGWSFSGVVAYELSRQMLQHRDLINKLVLIDALLPDSGGSPQQDASAVSLRARHEMAPDMLPPTFPEDVEPIEAERHLALYRANIAALHGYIPAAPPDVETINFEPSNRHGGKPLSVGNETKIVIPGDHFSIMSPTEIEKLGQTIGEALQPGPAVRRLDK